ncbi:MAG: FG-GAP repeat domain-containing protein, partial [Myxococcota bacterium]
SPPCVGDIDGDGGSEVLVPGGERMNAYEADGTVAWSAPMYGNDGTGWYAGTTGCAVFDFDRDGAVEIVFGDAMGLRILDGRTGATVWETGDYAAYMQLMGPVIADVDADGSAEILAVSTGHVLSGGESWMGLQIYGHPRDAWRTEGTAWGVHDYAVGNQSGGGMADEPVDTWNDPGVFRGQVATPAASEPLPALTVEVADACAACDADAAHVAAVIGNVGAADATGAAVELRAVAADGSSRVLARAGIGDVAAGRTAAAVDLAWAPSDVAADERVEVVAVLDGEVCAVGSARVAVAPACE